MQAPDTRTEAQKNYVAATIARMKSEIVADMLAGRVPVRTFTFGDLHGYVDANEYGGMCDDSVEGELKGLDLMASMFPDPADSIDHGTINSQAGMDVAEEMQDTVNEWLVKRGHFNVLPQYLVEFPKFGALDVVLPAGFVDDSWHDDSAPKFCLNGKDTEETGESLITIFIDYADESLQDIPGMCRFSAKEGDGGDSFESNDWAEILKWVAQRRAAYPAGTEEAS